ncbi:Beta-galactosidase [Trueperella pyogenes]|uniref:glycoside hydrolase family 2 TIM barrel-domain containing protein n=1 Tax=Trueperella pyogenes TaxID=1661 RepID=UPI000E00A43B|nr:glycoside hydrolase family 2 TIM barrel-domain containing protein [Trueperella pyogenes]SUO87865.1 Beta-galactosidase [Trueperella pyogenes]
MTHVDQAMLADPASFAINRRAAHSDHRWYASRAEADAGRSSFETCLDGVWKYFHAHSPAGVPVGLESPQTDISAWDDVVVPGHIQLAGYDRPQYVNVQYPWDGHEDIAPGDVPTEFNPVSTYATDALFPAARPGEQLTFVAEGAESALALWVDGTFIGYSEGSFLPAEFDVTEFADGANHRIVCRVWKWSAGSWLEDQDFIRLSGLYRSVFLRLRPRCHIENICVTSEITPEAARISVEIEGIGLEKARVAAELDGVGEFTRNGNRLSIEVPSPRLWTAEDPHLYRMRMSVSDGELLEVIDQPVGIRTVAIEGALLRVNGKPVKLKGVNRHEFGPRGRVPDEELLTQDLIALKRLGVNAIRTSHYPNSTPFYELCDLLGFYVIDEAGLETHGMWDRIIRGEGGVELALPGDREEWYAPVADRVTTMVARDRNHPCVIMWSLGNESYGGSVLARVADLVRALDARPIHYEGIFHDQRYPDTSDVASQMYTSAAGVADYLREHSDKPFILCEFAHAMGNSFGAVDRYMELMRREAHFQGVFVWDFADQALPIRDAAGREYFGYGGDFGEAPHDGDFSGNGLFFADHKPKPQTQALKALYQPLLIDVGEDGFTVASEYVFAGTAQLTCEVSLSREGVCLESSPVAVDLDPGQRGTFALPFQLPTEVGEYAIDVRFLLAQAQLYAPAGFEVARGQHVFRVGEPPALPRGLTAGVHRTSGALKVIDTVHNIGVRGDGFEVMFSRLYGGLQSYSVGAPGCARQILAGMPSVNFWHAPTSNERGWGAPMEDGQWLLASRYSRMLGDMRVSDGDSVEVSWTLELASAPVSRCEISARVYPDSSVVLTARLEPGAGLGDPPEFGFLIPVDPSLRNVRWYGEGPEESAVDRRQGAYVGLYETDVAMLTPYLRPQECGSRTGVRWAQITDAEGHGIEVAAQSEMEFSALPASPFELENALHPDELGPHRRTWLRPGMRRGVGGDDSWGARTHPEYLLPLGPLEFTVAISAIDPAGN